VPTSYDSQPIVQVIKKLQSSFGNLQHHPDGTRGTREMCEKCLHLASLFSHAVRPGVFSQDLNVGIGTF